jgi:hypothetical protein
MVLVGEPGGLPRFGRSAISPVASLAVAVLMSRFTLSPLEDTQKFRVK